LAGIIFALSVATCLPAAAQALRGELVQSTFHATDGRVNEVTADFSRDHKFLLTGHTDRTARLWDVASGRKIRQLGPHPGPVVAVAFAPGGKLVGISHRAAR
jgi:WD40 repeat protein